LTGIGVDVVGSVVREWDEVDRDTHWDGCSPPAVLAPLLDHVQDAAVFCFEVLQAESLGSSTGLGFTIINYLSIKLHEP